MSRRAYTDPATGHAPDLTSTTDTTPGLTGPRMLAALRASMRPAAALTPAAPERHDCDASACPYWCERDD